MADAKVGNVAICWKFFGKGPGYGGADGGTLAAFKKEWDSLTDRDKIQLSEGLGNGTLTY